MLQMDLSASVSVRTKVLPQYMEALRATDLVHFSGLPRAKAGL